MARRQSSEGFTGFADPKFFRDLAKHQSRDWFNANKSVYDEGFAKPMSHLLSELSKKLDRSYPDCELGEPKVFRLHRDVRFSKDKSPYKTHVSGLIPVKLGAGRVTETPAALYLQLGFEAASGKYTSMAGAGLYMMDPAQLEKFRKGLLDDKRGAEVARIVKALGKKGAELEAGGRLKNAPRGVDPSHPRAELLKLKGLVAMFGDLPASAIKSHALVDRLLERGKACAPLVRWLTWQTR